jgi:hypothetical protein
LIYISNIPQTEAAIKPNDSFIAGGMSDFGHKAMKRHLVKHNFNNATGCSCVEQKYHSDLHSF